MNKSIIGTNYYPVMSFNIYMDNELCTINVQGNNYWINNDIHHLFGIDTLTNVECFNHEHGTMHLNDNGVVKKVMCNQFK